MSPVSDRFNFINEINGIYQCLSVTCQAVVGGKSGTDEAALEQRLLVVPERPREHLQPGYGYLGQGKRRAKVNGLYCIKKQVWPSGRF